MGATCQGLATDFVGKGARLSSWSGVCCHREADLGGACASTEGVMPSRQWLLTFCCLGSGCCQGTPKKEDLYTVSHEVKFSFANLGKITSREHLESIKSLRDLCAKQSQRALHLFFFSLMKYWQLSALQNIHQPVPGMCSGLLSSWELIISGPTRRGPKK